MTDNQKFKNLERVIACLEEQNSFSRDIAARGRSTFGEPWCAEFDEVIGRLLPDDEALGKALAGYTAFAFDALKRQRRFEKDRVYQSTSYAEAAAQVYFNESHMMGKYLPGLLLSHYFWPHHYNQLNFFRQHFILAIHGAGQFVDIGIGTGIYSRLTLQGLPDIKGRGVDISAFSQKFTQDHIARFGHEARYETQLCDIMTDDHDLQTKALICVEVLEHLENPLHFLKALRAILEPGGTGFITAALNAPDKDHIYLYRHVDEVESQIKEAGFTVAHRFHEEAYAREYEDQPVPSVAAFVVT